LGNTLAQTFWEDGANLALLARSADALDRLVADLDKRPGQEAITLPLDLSDADIATEIADRVIARLPRIDVLINNAAIQGPIGRLWENEWSEWIRTIQTNLISPVALCRAVAPLMVEQGGGSIINLSGGGAAGPRANFSAYATAKCGLVRFSETLAEELRPHKVRVNCIAPGAMNTEMLAEIVNRGVKAAGKMEHAQALKVQGDGGASMQNVAQLCIFLASQAGSGITGKLISAVWDPWSLLPEHLNDLSGSDIYTLRRIVPKDRGKTWGNDQ
jgi:3-oxoacyl-[acyl-carrier protein] reductase